MSLPAHEDEAFCTNPIGTVDVFGLAPEKLAGWNFRPAGDNKKFIPDEYFALPSLGVWMGAGAVPNAEEIAAQNPDALLCFWTADEVGANMADEVQNQTGLPVVLVDYDVRSAPTTFRLLGDLMGCSERAEELRRIARASWQPSALWPMRFPKASESACSLRKATTGLPPTRLAACTSPMRLS